MKKWVPITLWLLVLVLAIWVWNQRRGPGGAVEGDPVMEGTEDGRLFKELPWSHLPKVGDFRLQDQQGEPFSSAAQIGRPLLVNFFFSTCPTICRQFNGQMQELASQFKTTDLGLISITVDPETDSPEILRQYAESFLADPQQWKFLTGQPHQIRQLGELVFRVPLEKATHTEKIFLIDRWGKIRDWFEWNDAGELRRLKETVTRVLAESAPPWEQTIRTRYALAGGFADRWAVEPWLQEFKLNDSEGRTFYSRDLEGQVWLASFFFSSCPGVCPQLNRHLAGYQQRLSERGVPMVSITTDPVTDTPEVLREYARNYRRGDTDWRFLTGDPLLIRRVGAEFFRATSDGEHHLTRLYLVDRWGNVRGEFDWQVPADEAALWSWIEQLQAETRPPQSLERVYPPAATPSVDPDDDLR
jgi:cytochrome oxidase Cu insertion factor (SCO1/SenC/PrrC family)